MKTKLLVLLSGILFGMYTMYYLQSNKSNTETPKANTPRTITDQPSRTYKNIQKQLQGHAHTHVDAYPFGLDYGNRAVHNYRGRITPPYFY